MRKAMVSLVALLMIAGCSSMPSPVVTAPPEDKFLAGIKWGMSKDEVVSLMDTDYDESDTLLIFLVDKIAGLSVEDNNIIFKFPADMQGLQKVQYILGGEEVDEEELFKEVESYLNKIYIQPDSAKPGALVYSNDTTKIILLGPKSFEDVSLVYRSLEYKDR